jgi:hypothetical protein
MIEIPSALVFPPAVLVAHLTHSAHKYKSLQSIEVFFVLITGKFYALGILRTINSRTKWRERMKSHDIGRVSLSDWQWEQQITTPPSGPIGIELASSRLPPSYIDS